MVLARQWSSLPLMLRFSGVVLCQSGCCAHGWQRVPSGVPCTSAIGSWMFPLCILHHTQVPQTGTCRLDLLFLSTGSCSVSLEMNLYTIFVADLLNTFSYALGVWDDSVSYAGLVLQRFLSVVPFLVLSAPCSVVSSWMLPSSWLLFRSLLWTLFIAHLGCLHLDRSSLRCYYSLLQSSCPIQTILALWIRVLMTLYLAARLWWLSYCKYWSVWVGFLYIEIDKELSSSGFTKVSRKGIALFLWLPSTVNIIAVSKLLMWSRNNCLLASCWMTKVSSTT